MIKPVCVDMALMSSAINVVTERIGRTFVRNVILLNRVLGLVEYPLLPIAPPKVRSEFLSSRMRGCRIVL